MTTQESAIPVTWKSDWPLLAFAVTGKPCLWNSFLILSEEDQRTRKIVDAFIQSSVKSGLAQGRGISGVSSGGLLYLGQPANRPALHGGPGTDRRDHPAEGKLRRSLPEASSPDPGRNLRPAQAKTTAFMPFSLPNSLSGRRNSHSFLTLTNRSSP